MSVERREAYVERECVTYHARENVVCVDKSKQTETFDHDNTHSTQPSLFLIDYNILGIRLPMLIDDKLPMDLRLRLVCNHRIIRRADRFRPIGRPAFLLPFSRDVERVAKHNP